MGELGREQDSDNVNVTLERRGSEYDSLVGRQFPCPVCGVGLDIRITQKKRPKPYCVCETCGIQVFFRGKEGIRRLREILHSQTLITAEGSKADLAVILFNRIQQLREQKKQLEAKQGLIIRDPDLQNAIRVVDNEIKRAQIELAKLGRKGPREKNK